MKVIRINRFLIVLVLLLIFLWTCRVFYAMGLVTAQQKKADFVRAVTLAALTLHRDHFRIYPENYHLLVWDSSKENVPGVTLHEVYHWRFGLNATSCNRMVYLLVERYNRVSMMRACSDVLNNKCTKATRFVLQKGERLYPDVRKSKLSSLVDKAIEGDTNARQIFSKMINFYFDIIPYKFYLDSVVLRTESIDFGTCPTDESFGRHFQN